MGTLVGADVGKADIVGADVGDIVGIELGRELGANVGSLVGTIVGTAVGAIVGAAVGMEDIVGFGDVVGTELGAGEIVGEAVGSEAQMHPYVPAHDTPERSFVLKKTEVPLVVHPYGCNVEEKVVPP